MQNNVMPPNPNVPSSGSGFRFATLVQEFIDVHHAAGI